MDYEGARIQIGQALRGHRLIEELAAKKLANGIVMPYGVMKLFADAEADSRMRKPTRGCGSPHHSCEGTREMNALIDRRAITGRAASV